MTKLTKFDPPAHLNDFDSIANQSAAWNEVLSHEFDIETQCLEKVLIHEAGEGVSQFYNPTVIDTPSDSTNSTIPWNGFPRQMQVQSKYWHAEKLWARPARDWEYKLWGVDTIAYRPQDEYCEWHTDRNEDGEIIRVSFTCEGPEYWECFANGYPNREIYGGPKQANAKGDLKKVLALYQDYISPDVKEEDLVRNGYYYPYNKWNTTHGAMHLTHPANTLFAEINIAARATILRKDPSGQPIIDADALIKCSRYGNSSRWSDPTIGGSVNQLAQDGKMISLQNPVGLYISHLDTSGFETLDHSDPAQYCKIVRGKEGMIIRLVYEVPPEKDFNISQISIGGNPIIYGSQIAEHINMKLTGVSFNKGINNPLLNCPSDDELDVCDAGNESLSLTRQDKETTTRLF